MDFTNTAINCSSINNSIDLIGENGGGVGSTMGSGESSVESATGFDSVIQLSGNITHFNNITTDELQDFAKKLLVYKFNKQNASNCDNLCEGFSADILSSYKGTMHGYISLAVNYRKCKMLNCMPIIHINGNYYHHYLLIPLSIEYT